MLLALELDGFLQGWLDGDEIGGDPPLVVVVDGHDEDRAIGHALDGGAPIGRGAGLDQDGPQVVALYALIE